MRKIYINDPKWRNNKRILKIHQEKVNWECKNIWNHLCLFSQCFTSMNDKDAYFFQFVLCFHMVKTNLADEIRRLFVLNKTNVFILTEVNYHNNVCDATLMLLQYFLCIDRSKYETIK